MSRYTKNEALWPKWCTFPKGVLRQISFETKYYFVAPHASCKPTDLEFGLTLGYQSTLWENYFIYFLGMSLFHFHVHIHWYQSWSFRSMYLCTTPGSKLWYSSRVYQYGMKVVCMAHAPCTTLLQLICLLAFWIFGAHFVKCAVHKKLSFHTGVYIK
jgi:hypothetical protein